MFSGRERAYLKNKHDGFKGKRETDVYLIVILIIKLKKKKSEIVRTNKREKKWRVRLGGG